MENPAQPLTARQTRSLEHLTYAHDRLLGLIAGLDEEILTGTPVMGDWTIKDLLGHVVSWNREFRAEIRLILAGRHPGYEQFISDEAEFNRWNQTQVALKCAWSWGRICADLDMDFQEAADLIRRLTPQDFRQRGVTSWKKAARQEPTNLTNADTDSVETLVNFHWRHMNEHARYLEKWLRQR